MGRFWYRGSCREEFGGWWLMAMQDAIVFSTMCIFRTFTLPTVNKKPDEIHLQI
jgi:hypothetical protein